MSPSIFREKGYRFYFLSNEEERIHIHVTCVDGEAKFWLHGTHNIISYISWVKSKKVERNSKNRRGA